MDKIILLLLTVLCSLFAATDDFNTANKALAGYRLWVKPTNATGGLYITNNRVINNAGTGFYVNYYDTTTSNNQFAEAWISAGFNNNGVVVRANANSAYVLRLANADSLQIQVVTFPSTVTASAKFKTFSYVDSVKVRLVASNDTLYAYGNDTLEGYLVDNTITSGFSGVFSNGSSATKWVDNWSGGSLINPEDSIYLLALLTLQGDTVDTLFYNDTAVLKWDGNVNEVDSFKIRDSICTIVSFNSDSCIFVVPTGIETGNIIISVSGLINSDTLKRGGSVDSVYISATRPDPEAPTLTSVSPSSDTTGAELLFIGSNLVSVGTVKLDTLGITLVRISETQDTIYTIIPDSIPAGVYTPIIQWPGGSDSIVDGFEVILPEPIITSVTPSASKAGKQIKFIVKNGSTIDSAKLNSVLLTVDSISAAGDTLYATTPSWMPIGVYTTAYTFSDYGNDTAAISFRVYNPAVDTVKIDAMTFSGKFFNLTMDSLKVGTLKANIVDQNDTTVYFTLPSSLDYGNDRSVIYFSDGDSLVFTTRFQKRITGSSVGIGLGIGIGF